MNGADILVVLQWWGMLFLIGIIFLPVSFRLFPAFLDRGYIFAKTLGIIITTYLLLVLGVLHILPFTQLSAIGAIGILFLLLHLSTLSFSNGTIKIKKDYFQSVWDLRRIILLEEILFLLVLFFWAYVRSFAPEIHGLEKYMDFGFVNSALRATHFPPKDMWLPPESINYYYFGHVATAVLTKLSGIASYLTYNLMLATIAGLCFVSSFSLAVNLYRYAKTQFAGFSIKAVAAGILSALLVTMGGNLHILYAFFAPYENEHPVPLWTKAFQLLSFPNNYWYPNATRFIENTIHEFPIYSWVVADLHGHVLDIPIVLLTLAVAFSCLLYAFDQKKSTHLTSRSLLASFTQSLLLPLPLLVFAGFLLAVMYMTNAWDGVIYFLLFSLLLVFLSWRELAAQALRLPKKLIRSGVNALSSIVVIGITYGIFSLPFSLFFKPFVSGIGVLCAPKFLTDMGHFGPFLFEVNHCSQSPPWQMAILYGFFAFFAVSLLIFLRRRKERAHADVFAIMLILLSTFLILIPEFIYVKDIYPAHYRANTMFKLVFQAFIMLSLVSGYALARILSALGPTMTIRPLPIKIVFSGWFITSFVLVVLVMLYPQLAINSYYGDLKTYQGLNGVTYLKNQYPTDFEAIVWMNDNIPDQPVILEAQGDSYTDFARVSSNTGLPTVLGWTVHEWLWRGSYDIPAPRIAEVQTLYESADLDETKSLLEKYKVEYVFIGDLEYQKYPTLNEQKFAELGEKVFEEGQTKIYKITR